MLLPTVSEKSYVGLLYNPSEIQTAVPLNICFFPGHSPPGKVYFGLVYLGLRRDIIKSHLRKSFCPTGAALLTWLKFLTVQWCRMHTGQEILRAGRV